MERGLQTLHTYIQPFFNFKEEGIKQRQHIAAKLLQHNQVASPIIQRCWTAVIG